MMHFLWMEWRITNLILLIYIPTIKKVLILGFVFSNLYIEAVAFQLIAFISSTYFHRLPRQLSW